MTFTEGIKHLKTTLFWINKDVKGGVLLYNEGTYTLLAFRNEIILNMK